MRNALIVIGLCGVLTGCATANLTVRIDPGEIEAMPASPLAEVTVHDLRAPGVAASTRQAAFGTPMGNVTFNPPESQLVKSVLEAELTRLMREKGIQEKKKFSCDIVEFAVNTNTTPLYWDVIGRIRLVLKQDGKEYPLVGSDTQRTYIWPGETIIKNVVQQSLGKIVTDLKSVAIER